MGPGESYTIFLHQGKSCGAAWNKRTNPALADVPPFWLSFLNVTDLDAAVAAVRAHGGAVQLGPMEVGEHGLMAVCEDPGGAGFCLWKAKSTIGVEITGEPGTVCWMEVATRHPEKVSDFYKGVFGWTGKPSANSPAGADYEEFTNGEGAPHGGMLTMTKEWEGIPSHWMPYFQVTDCAASAARVKELGGTVKYGPFLAPNVGQIAVVQDPQGAMLSLIQLA
jgi:predicted enzyme related to lactoylglutathione lyase